MHTELDSCVPPEGSSLMPSVRHAFQLHRDSSDASIHRSTKEALLRMVNIVVERMENTAQNIDLNGIGKYGWCVVCDAPAPHYCKDTKQPICSPECKQKNLQQPSLPILTSSTSSTQPPHPPTTFSSSHRDALTLFHSLCKMIMKIYNNDNNTTILSDERAIRTSRLALELVKEMLLKGGPMMKTCSRFIGLIRSLLCIILINTSVCPLVKIFELSLSTFLVIVSKYKDYLKAEIGIFLDNVFVRILTSPNSSFQHKYRVLEVLLRLSSDAKILMELFINFDCVVGEPNVFSNTVECLSDLARGKYVMQTEQQLLQSEQQLLLRIVALKSLTTLALALSSWVEGCVNEDSPDESAEETTKGEGEEGDSGDFDGEGEEKKEENETKAPGRKLEEQREIKSIVSKGIHLFNKKPNKGLALLQEQQILGTTAKEVATFFIENPLHLDKKSIGDFLGEDIEFNKQVLFELVDFIPFHNLQIDAALQKFLSFFRIPGEGQKIDRMMEKFGEKFLRDNPQSFSSADTCYVLSFAIIMLHTDSHNTAIAPERKMSVQDFLRQCKGIDNGNDLSPEYLVSLYDRVTKREWVLEDDDEKRLKHAHHKHQNTLESKKKFELYLKESVSIIQRSTKLINNKRFVNQEFVSTTRGNFEDVPYMLDILCWPMLAACSTMLENVDDETGVSFAISGLKTMSRLCGVYNMATERDALVNCLRTFTAIDGMVEMKKKNVLCVAALLNLGMEDGNLLGDSWVHVLHVVSQVERIVHCSIDRRPDGREGKEGKEWKEERDSGLMRNLFGYGGKSRRAEERVVGVGTSAMVEITNVIGNVDVYNSLVLANMLETNHIDVLFTSSTKLNDHAIISFVEALCKVSKEELMSEISPRVFSLQKLVETADFNMHRLRYVWIKIWTHLKRQFSQVVTHKNLSVSLYAIDALRQLTLKFLSKTELERYLFQHEFLLPFDNIMADRHIYRESKDLTVSIICYLSNVKGHLLKSGWKVVLRTFAFASLDPQFNKIAFAALELVYRDYFTVISDAYFDILIHTLTMFVLNNDSDENRIRALSLIESCAYSLGKQYADEKKKTETLEKVETAGKDGTAIAVSSKESTAANSTEGPVIAPQVKEIGSNNPHAKEWIAKWTKLCGVLSSLASYPGLSPNIQNRAQVIVYSIFDDIAVDIFDKQDWHQVFNTLLASVGTKISLE